MQSHSEEMSISKIFHELAEGSSKRNHAYHLMTISNINQQNLPEIRTVVNRGFESNQRKIFFHTDIRSSKIMQFEQNPQTAILLYNPSTKIQLRLACKAKVNYQNEITLDRWKKTRDFSRICYLQINTPSQPMSQIEPENDEYGDDERGYQNFAVIENQFNQLDYLILSHKKHKRYLFEWDSDNNLKYCELAP